MQGWFWRDNHTGLLPKQPVVILWLSWIKLDHGFRQKPRHCGLQKVEPRNNWRMGTPWEVSMESVNRELGWGEISRNPNGCGSFTCVKKPVGNRFLGIFSLFHSIQTTRQKKDSSLPTIVLFDLSVAHSVYSLLKILNNSNIAEAHHSYAKYIVKFTDTLEKLN